MTYDIILCIAGITERAPADAFDNVDFLAAIHLCTLFYSGKLQEFFECTINYEQKFLLLPEDDKFRNNTLGGIYCLLGNVHFMMCTFDDCYEFDSYYAKANKYWLNSPPEVIKNVVLPLGSWVTTLGSSETKSLNEYTAAIQRSTEQLSLCCNCINGFYDLYQGELKFYQNELREADAFLFDALEQGRKHKQFDTINRALFYALRIAINKGNLKKSEQILKELEILLDEVGYSRRNFVYDVTLGWYYCIIRQTDMVPDWLKGEFGSYYHAHFLENYSNQIKARYYYLKRNYQPLLSYINEMKKRESILYGRVEMLAIEACVRYQMKNKTKAFKVLCEAYETASPNDIIMPFIELGKDMRTLTATALREDMCVDIPRSWLESIKNKATSYAKSQSMFITKHRLSETSVNNTLSSREQDVLSDLYHGFSQSEIATKHSLSINTVKMVTKSIYGKLNVHKISDLIRVAAEQRLV